jgi:hypothetical protein
VPTSRAPFLSYLTVFRSRLGLVNLVLDVTPLGHQPDRALRRRVLHVLEERVELDLDDVNNDAVFQYLVDKKMLGGNPRSGGRYRGIALTRSNEGVWHAESALQGALTRIPIHQTDLWFADSEMPSTIGVPTPDNVKEVIEFAFQLHILDRSKNSWTSSGHLVNGLRNMTVSQLANSANPFLLGAESAALLWILLERDGLFLRELLRFLSGRDIIRRDDVADALPTLADRAIDAASILRLPSQSITEGRKLVSSLSEVDSTGKARAPGVREHRSSPRLEWLTDLGYLSKDGLPKNAFEYRVSADVTHLLSLLDGAIEAGGDWCFNAALSAWRVNSYWEDLRAATTASNASTALGWAYATLRRPIGPAPLRHVAFLTGLLFPDIEPNEAVTQVISLTQETPGASLSGGRMTRSPENIYLTDESLKALGVR